MMFAVVLSGSCAQKQEKNVESTPTIEGNTVNEAASFYCNAKVTKTGRIATTNLQPGWRNHGCWNANPDDSQFVYMEASDPILGKGRHFFRWRGGHDCH